MKTTFRLSSLFFTVTTFALSLGWLSERTRRIAVRDKLERDMAVHINGNLSIQVAWEAYEIASAFADDPEHIKETLDSDLIYGVYGVWRTQEDVDFAFARRSPGNTAFSLANTLLRQLDCEISRDYFSKASRIPLAPHAPQALSGGADSTVLDSLDLTVRDREELEAFISVALKSR